MGWGVSPRPGIRARLGAEGQKLHRELCPLPWVPGGLWGALGRLSPASQGSRRAVSREGSEGNCWEAGVWSMKLVKVPLSLAGGCSPGARAGHLRGVGTLQALLSSHSSTGVGLDSTCSESGFGTF